jgi:hypothetical protein
MHFFEFLKALLQVFTGGGWWQSHDHIPARIRRHLRYTERLHSNRIRFPGSGLIMPFFYFFQALLQAFVSVWQDTRPPPSARQAALARKARGPASFLSGGWKYIIVIPVFVLGVAWSVRQSYESFQEKPPAWLKQRERASPGLSGLYRPDAPWNQFSKLLDLAQTESRKNRMPVNMVQFYELGKKAGEIILWQAETMTNPGFKAFNQIERDLWFPPANLIGFYTADGRPLSYTVKSVDGKPNIFWATIYIEKPLAPGESMILVRREKQMRDIRPSKAGQYSFGIGRLGGPPDTIQARGVRVPEGGSIVEYGSQGGVNINLSDTPTVFWVNTLVEQPNAPVGVTFRCDQWQQQAAAKEPPKPPAPPTAPPPAAVRKAPPPPAPATNAPPVKP